MNRSLLQLIPTPNPPCKTLRYGSNLVACYPTLAPIYAKDGKFKILSEKFQYLCERVAKNSLCKVLLSLLVVIAFTLYPSKTFVIPLGSILFTAFALKNRVIINFIALKKLPTIVPFSMILVINCCLPQAGAGLPFAMRNSLTRRNAGAVRAFVLKQFEPNVPESDPYASGPFTCPAIYANQSIKKSLQNILSNNVDFTNRNNYETSYAALRSFIASPEPLYHTTPSSPGLSEALELLGKMGIALVRNDNPNVIFKQTKDRFMTQVCKEKLDLLSMLVSLEWPGVKVKVLKGWTVEDDDRSRRTLHTCGRALDITVSDYDHGKNGFLAGLARKAEFHWVHYRQRSFIHVSVQPDGNERQIKNVV